MKELIILDEDKAYARQRIAELDTEIQGLGPEFYDVFNQSSETWHDNAPFDALRDRQSLLDAERQQLRQLLRAGTLTVPKPKKGIIGIGSRVTLDSGKRYFIAGDWTPRAGQVHGDVFVVSAASPLGQALIGRRAGDDVAAGKLRGKIVEIGT